MKNLSDYINESVFTEGLFGLGGTKQGEFARQICSGLVGIGYIFRSYIKKFIKKYEDGPLAIQTALVDGKNIIYKSSSIVDYDIPSDNQNVIILAKVGDKCYNIRFSGAAGKNNEYDDNVKIGKEEQRETLLTVFYKLQKEILDALIKPLKNWDSSHPNVKRLDSIMYGLLNEIRNKHEFLLKLGTPDGQLNTKYLDKLFIELIEKYSK